MICEHCGQYFEPHQKYRFSKLCWDCVKKRNRALEEYDALLIRIAYLEEELEKNTSLFEGNVKKLIRLCHPDRHLDTPREKTATEVTQWLTRMLT